MVVKDRLQEMKTLMKDEDRTYEAENSSKEMPTSLVKFFEYVRTIRVEVEELKSKLKQLKILLAENQHWTDPKSRKEVEQKIEKEKFFISNSAKAIRNNLTSMKKMPWDGVGTSIVHRIKDVQITSIISELNSVIREYLQCLVQERERSVKIFKDMLQVKGDDVSDVNSLLEEGKISIFVNNLLLNDMEEKYQLREAEEKRQGILKIESSILEISNLFNELALIVDLQTEKIDEVEKLMNKNLTDVNKTDKLLESANKKKRKIVCRKIIVGLICSGVILFVLVLLIYT